MGHVWAVIAMMLIPAGQAAAYPASSEDLIYAFNADFGNQGDLIPEVPDDFVAQAGSFTIDRDLVPDSGSVLLPLSVIENFSFSAGSFPSTRPNCKAALAGPKIRSS